LPSNTTTELERKPAPVSVSEKGAPLVATVEGARESRRGTGLPLGRVAAKYAA
jgi:hypothetical protein